MKVGDKVTKDLVMRVENPKGTIVNITKEYVVVKWDNINGQWHYTCLLYTSDAADEP